MTALRLADYLDHTVPWAKQDEAFNFSADRKLCALIMEQRTGKSIVSIGRMAYLYERKRVIDAVLVVAMPSGVPQNWADELDGNPIENMKPRFPARIPHRTLVWRSDRADTKKFKAQFEELLAFKGLAILCVNGEAILTKSFRREALRFLKKRKVFAIADETSLLMKGPGKRATVMDGVKKYAEWRMILDGTPADESPFDLFTPYAWLSHAILGHSSYQAFKTHHGEFKVRPLFGKTMKCYKCFGAGKKKGVTCTDCNGTGKKDASFEELIKYRNLDELNRNVYTVSFRVTRKECFDIPDKLYTPYTFELSGPQRRVYDDLAETYEAELADGTTVSATMVLTRYLRLQQVGSNYWPSEKALALCRDCGGHGCETCDDIGAYEVKLPVKVVDAKVDSRLAALAEVASVNRGQLIVWARFTADIDKVMKLGAKLNLNPVRYDGTLGHEAKLKSKSEFQGGHAGWIVCNESAAQRGLNLSAAQAHVYYSNEFSGLKRTQSEDRTEVAGRSFGTGVIDLIAAGTVDEDIVAAHLSKRSVAEVVMRKPASHRFTR